MPTAASLARGPKAKHLELGQIEGLQSLDPCFVLASVNWPGSGAIRPIAIVAIAGELGRMGLGVDEARRS